MKRYLKSIYLRASAVTLILAVGLNSAGCSDTSGKQAPHENTGRAVVTNSGLRIAFPQGSPGLSEFRVQTVVKGSATLSLTAPARIVASFSLQVNGKSKIILFDSPDVTTLYSQYRQSKANVKLTETTLERIKQMYSNLAVTAKDLNQAETDASTAKAALEEMEGRLRVLGFDPSELESVKGNRVWLMASVPEDQIHEIIKGEPVKIKFDAYPGDSFTGRAEALGDIIDPSTREVKVRIALYNPGGRLLPGMFAQVDFGNKINGAFILPLSAVVTVEGDNYLFVQTMPNVFERRTVIIANSDASNLVILSGITSGEKVVISGAMLLKGLSFGY